MISKAVRTCGLKWIASTLVLCLVIQDFSYAAPELLKADLGWRIEDGGQKQKNLHWAKKLLPPIPESVATIEDAYQVPQGSDPSGTKTVILIQDPHTNFSGQKNIAKILESLLSSSKALAMSSPRSLIGDQTDSRLRGNDEPFVFVEAGFGDVSLTALKGADPKKRENVGLKYLRAGELSGPEYLNLTTKNDFTLLGVEDESLYWQSLEVYRAIVKKRQKFQEYLEKAANTAQILKSKTFNPFLLAFDQKHEDFLKEKIAIADYFVALMDQARALGLEVARYPNAQKFSHLKEQESRINFDLAGREQLKAVASLSSADQEELKPALSSSSAKSGHAQQLVLVKLLEEKIKNLEAYPNLKLYLEYLNQSQHLNTPELLEEQKLLEAAVYKALIQVPDEEALHKASLALRNLKALLNLTLTPDEFRAYEENPKDFDITKMSGFLNRRIMELKDNYDKAIFLEEGYEEILQKCRTFYELTRKRDEKFVEKIQREWIKMDGGLRMDDRGKHNPPSSILNPRSGISILITGGYHSPNLKALLKSKNISYISVTPQVVGETNRKRYEELLLSEKPSGASASADKMGILALVNRPAASRLATVGDLAKELQVTLPSAARLAGQSVDEQIAALQQKLLDVLETSFIHPDPAASLRADSHYPMTQLFMQSLSVDESRLVAFAENVLENITLLVGSHKEELTKMIDQANLIIAQMKEEGSPLAVTLPSFGQWLALPTMNYRDIASYKEQHRKFLIYVKTYDDINAATLRAGLNGSHLRRYYDPDDEVDLLVLKPLLKFIFGYLKRHDDLSSELKRDIHRAVINSLVFPAFQQALSQESWEDIKDKSFVETISAILDTEDRVLVSHMAREVAQDPLLLKKSASLPDYLAGEIGSLSLGNIHEIQLRNANHLIQTPADPAMTAYEWVTGQKILGELVSDSLREQLTLNFKDLQNLGVDAGVRLANEETLENKLKFQLVGGYEPGSGNLIVVKMPGNKALILDLGHDPKSDTPIEQKSVKLREALGGYTPVAAFITHAHLDHCLYAPWFHRDYPDAKIISSQTTARLLFDQWKDVLGGGAHILRTNWLRLVGKVFGSLVTIKTGQWYQAQEDVKIFMSHAGHIPGAVSLTVATPYGNFTYSGDTSTTSRLTLPPNAMVPPKLKTGTFIVDATNAHLDLEPIETRRKMLIDAVRKTYERGGKVLIPAFILGRAEEIALILKQAVERGELPKNFPIYMDGGAVETVKKLRGDPDYAEFKSWFRNDSPIREITDSDHPDKDTCVIIAGSGMLYGGTAIGHLEKLIEDEKNTVIMVGWLAEDSPAFRLLRTAKGKDFTFPPFRDGRTSATKKVQAKILHINFTAHGDHAEVVQLIQKVDSKVVVLVHAGEEARRSLREDPALSGYTIINNFSDASPIESAPSPEAQGQFSKIKAIELPAKQAQQFRDRQVALKTSSWLKDFDNKELQFYRTSGVSREQLKEALRIYFDARYDEEERKVKPTAEKNLRAEFKRGSPAEDALAAWKFLVKANAVFSAARLANQAVLPEVPPVVAKLPWTIDKTDIVVVMCEERVKGLLLKALRKLGYRNVVWLKDRKNYGAEFKAHKAVGASGKKVRLVIKPGQPTSSTEFLRSFNSNKAFEFKESVGDYFSPADDLKIITRKDLSESNTPVKFVSDRIQDELDKISPSAEVQAAIANGIKLNPTSLRSARALIKLVESKQPSICSVDAINQWGLQKHEFKAMADYLDLIGLAMKLSKKVRVGTHMRNVTEIRILSDGLDLVRRMGTEEVALARAIQNLGKIKKGSTSNSSRARPRVSGRAKKLAAALVAIASDENQDISLLDASASALARVAAADENEKALTVIELVIRTPKKIGAVKKKRTPSRAQMKLTLTPRGKEIIEAFGGNLVALAELIQRDLNPKDGARLASNEADVAVDGTASHLRGVHFQGVKSGIKFLAEWAGVNTHGWTVAGARLASAYESEWRSFKRIINFPRIVSSGTSVNNFSSAFNISSLIIGWNFITMIPHVLEAGYRVWTDEKSGNEGIFRVFQGFGGEVESGLNVLERQAGVIFQYLVRSFPGFEKLQDDVHRHSGADKTSSPVVDLFITVNVGTDWLLHSPSIAQSLRLGNRVGFSLAGTASHLRGVHFQGVESYFSPPDDLRIITQKNLSYLNVSIDDLSRRIRQEIDRYEAQSARTKSTTLTPRSKNSARALIYLADPKQSLILSVDALNKLNLKKHQFMSVANYLSLKGLARKSIERSAIPHLGGTQKRNVVKLTITPRGRELVELHRGGEADALAGAIQGALNLSREGARLAGKQAPAADSAVPSTPWTLAKEDVIAVIHNNEDARNLLAELLRGPSFGFTTVLVCKGLGDIPGEFEKLGLYEGDRVIKLAIRPDQRGGRTQFIFALKSSVNVAGGRNLPRFFVAEKDIKFIGNPILGNLWIDASDVEIALKAELEALGASAPVKTSKTMKVRKLTKAAQDSARMVSYLAKIKSHAITVTEANKKWSLEPKDFPNTVRYLNARGLISTDKVVARVPHFGGSTRKSEVTRATLLPIGLDLVARYPLADQDEEMLQALAHGIQDLREARSKSKPAAIKVKSAKPHTVKATPQSKKLANRLMMLGKQPDDDSLSIATSGHEMMTESMWHSIDEWLKDLELIYIKTEVLAAGRKAKSIEIQRNVTLTNQGADLLEAYLKNLNGLAQAIQGLLDAYDGARLADAPRPISLTDTVLVLHHDNLICQRLADLLEKRFEYTRVISLQSRDLIPGEFKRRELDVEANPIRLVISPGYTKDAVQFYRNLSKSLKVSRILALHQYFDAPPKLIKSSILGRRLADDLVVEEELERELGGNGVSKNKPSKQSVTKLTKKSIDSARLLLYMRQNDLLVMYSQDIKEAIEQSSTDIVHMAAYLVPIGIVEKEVIDLTPPTAGRSITTKLTLTETAANLASQYPNDETGLARAIQDIYESQGNGHAGRLKKSGRAEGARLASPADEGWALSKTDAVAVMHENQGVRERLTEALENMGYTSVLAFRNRAELTYTSESVDLSSAPKIKLLIAPGKGLAAAQFGQSLRAARTILGALLADDLKIIRETGLAYTLSPEDHFMNLLQLKLDEVQGLTDAARVDRPAAEPTLVQKAAAKVLVYLAGQPEASVHFLQAGDLWEMDPKTFSKAARQYLLPLKLVSRKEVPVEIADKRQGTRTISTKELSIEDPGRELVTKYQGDPDALARAIKDLERPVLADGARLAESGKKMKSTGAAWPWIVSATEPIAVMEWNDDAREKLVEALREIGFTKVLSFKDRGQALNQDMYHDLSLGKDFIRLLVTPDKRIRPDKALSPYRVLPLTDSQAQTRQYFHEDPWVIQGVYLKSKSTDLETLVKMLKKELDTISFPDRTPDSPPVRRTPTPYELKLASALVALAAQSHPIIDGPDAEQLWGVNRDGSYTIQENLQAIGLIDVGERRKRSVQSNGSLRNVRVNTLALTPLGRDLADRHKEDPEALARQLQLLRRKIKADAAAIPQSGSATGARLAAPEEAAGMLQVTDSVAVIHPDAEARGRLVRAMEKRGFESVIASNSLGGINQLFRQNTSQLTGGPIRLIIAPGFKRSASNVLGYLPQDVRPKFVSQDLILIRQPARDLSVDNEGEVEAALDAALKKVQAIVEVTPVKSALWAERSAAILIYLADSNHPTLSTLEVMQMYEFSHTSIFSALKRYLQSMNLVESKFIPASSIVGGGEKNTQVTQLTLSPEGRRVVAESEGDQKVLALAIQNIYTAAAAAKRARAKAYPAKIGARLAEESRGPRLAGFGATLAGFDELVLAVNSQGHLMALETSDRIAILSFRKKFPGQVQVYVGNRPFRIVKSRSGKTRGAQAAELISYQDLINTLKAFDRRFNQPLPKELAEKPIEAYLHLDSFKGLSIQDQAEAVKTLIYSIAARKTKYLEIHLVGEDRLVKLAQAVIASSSRLREKPFTVGDQIQHQEASQVHLLSQDYLKINRIALLGQATAKGVKARFVKIQDLVHDNNMEDIVLPNPLLSLMDRVGAIENLSVEDAVFNQVYEWFKNLTGFALSKEEFLGLILGDEALINLYAVPPTLRAVDLAEAMNAHAHFRRLSEQAA